MTTTHADASIKSRCLSCGKMVALTPAVASFGRWSGRCRCGVYYVGTGKKVAGSQPRAGIRVTAG